jgi:membrane protein YqaA with SNARE-associated domain
MAANMGGTKRLHWAQAIVASAGGLGLFLIGFLDSSFVPFPVINDLMVADLSMQRPALMPYYATMATLGSVVGCVVLYFIAKKGGEALFHKQAGPRAAQIRRWMDRNGFVSVLVAALLPPPTPFKIVVLAAPVCGVPLRNFTLALLLARSLRYFAVGTLAVRYGAAVIPYMLQHKFQVSGVSLAVVIVVYGLVHFVFRAPKPTATTP